MKKRKLTRLQLCVLQLCWRGPASLDGLGIPNGVPRSLKQLGLLIEPGAGCYCTSEEGVDLVREEIKAQCRQSLLANPANSVG
jgi:hypothetical protein